MDFHKKRDEKLLNSDIDRNFAIIVFVKFDKLGLLETFLHQVVELLVEADTIRRSQRSYAIFPLQHL